MKPAIHKLAMSLKLALVAFLLATITSSVWNTPHHLSYFNEVSGGRAHGFEHLLHSNYDWGQGLLELDRELDQHPEWGPVGLFIDPNINIDGAGSRAVPFHISQAQKQGLEYFSHIAISRNYLSGQLTWNLPESALERKFIDSLQAASPVSTTDGTIYIFQNRWAEVSDQQVDLHQQETVHFPSLVVTRDSSNSNLSLFLHCLLLNGMGPTGLKFPSTGEEALKCLTNEEFAVAAWGKSPFIRTRNGVRFAIDNSSISEGTVGESHRDQCLATFASLNLPLKYEIQLKSETLTIADLLSESIANFSFNQRETAWSALAYAHYLAPQREWNDRFGQTTSFSDFAKHLIDSNPDSQSCGGLHVVQAIAALHRADIRHGILTRSARLDVKSYLDEIEKIIIFSQHSNGYWNLSWRSESPYKYNASFEEKLIATGHMIELLNLLPDPPENARERAVNWTKKILISNQSDLQNVRVCPLTHAVRSVIFDVE